MRKTILTAAAVLGAAPTALAATGPLSAPALVGATVPSSGVAVQLAAANAHRARQTPGRQARAAGAERRRRAQANRSSAHASVASPQLQAIAQCESGGNPKAIGGGGQFRGKYQFTYGTWAAIGGSGDPASAPEAEQDRRAARLLASSGTGQWPVCG